MTPATATEAPEKEQPTAYSKDFASEEVTLRGRYFRLEEVSIGDFDKIEKQSVDKITEDDGTVTERFNANRRSRLLLAKSIVEARPPLTDIDSLGTRLVVALNTIVNRLHFGDPDKGALETEKELAKQQEGSKGNG